MPSRRACRHGAHAVTARMPSRRARAGAWRSVPVGSSHSRPRGPARAEPRSLQHRPAGPAKAEQRSQHRPCGLRLALGQRWAAATKQQGGQRGQERADEAQSGRSRDVIHDHQGLGFDLAYTFQEAWWMLNTSVVENVCLGQELDPAWQGRILEACALWADVDTIPAGVHTSFAEQKQNLGPAQGPSRLLCRQEARLRPERSVKSILEKDHTTSLTQMEVPLDDHDRTAWPTGKDSMQYGRISNFRKKPQERRFQDGQAPRERDRCRNRVVSTIPNEVQGSFCGSGWTVGINQIRQVEARQGTAPHRRRCMQPTGGQEDLPLWDFGSDTVLHPSPLQPTEQEIFAGLKSLSKLPEQGRAATLPAQELSAEGRGTKNRETAHAAGWVHPPPQQSPAD
ncbi:uncharacterized protein LOC104653327 isoform X3 [Saimiri boliviensis]|uniref:uncharacterized protein LOC104653327 isoform X3 n=1 Tax=Saimiri boliviensis TaxID=27679 RepID=UPI003D76F055